MTEAAAIKQFKALGKFRCKRHNLIIYGGKDCSAISETNRKANTNDEVAQVTHPCHGCPKAKKPTRKMRIPAAAFSDEAKVRRDKYNFNYSRRLQI